MYGLMDMSLVFGIRLIAWPWVQVGGRPLGSSNTSRYWFNISCITIGTFPLLSTVSLASPSSTYRFTPLVSNLLQL